MDNQLIDGLFNDDDYGGVPQQDTDPNASFVDGGVVSGEPTEVPDGQAERTVIPLRILEEERHRRQNAEAKLAETNQTLAVFNERLRVYAEQQQAQQYAAQAQAAAQADPEPDRNEDERGWYDWQLRRQQREIDQLKGIAAQGVQAQQNIELRNVQDRITMQSRDMQHQFANNHPDYYDAIDHLTNSRMQELKTMGYDDGTASQIIENEKGMIVAACIHRGPNGEFVGWTKNPAEVGYNIAMQRGWQNPATQPQQTVQQQPVQVPIQPGMPGADSVFGGAALFGGNGQMAPPNGNGMARPAPQPTAQPQRAPMTPEQKAQMLRAGQAQTRLNGGHAPSGLPTSIEEVNALPEDQLVQFMENHKALFNRLLGA